MVRVPDYRLYLDESGDHTYRNLEKVEHRYLGLAGIIFERDVAYRKLADDLESLKNKYWPDADPDEPVIFHREDMLRCRRHFSILRDTRIRDSFDEDMLGLLSKAEFTIIMVVLDKKIHMERYTTPYTKPWHPYGYCLRAMLERYCGWLRFFGRQGDVLAESRGGKEDRQLKKVFNTIFGSGTNVRCPTFFQSALTSSEIKIKPKKNNIPGLQIADILAYPLREKTLFEKGIRSTNFLGTFNETICDCVRQKVNRQFYTGRISGYGEVFIGER